MSWSVTVRLPWKAISSLNGALAKGSIGAKTSERIALAVAEINGCSYCLSAHSYLGTNIAQSWTTRNSTPTAKVGRMTRKPTPLCVLLRASP